MKFRRVLLVPAIAVLALAACDSKSTKSMTVAGQKINARNELKIAYQTETGKDKFNYLSNSWTYNSDQYANMVDGLVENDRFNAVSPAIAESWSAKDNADGTQTWTFKLRKGVMWVENATGKEYAEVKADDFVTGIKYVLNPANGSATVGVITGAINNAKAYYDSLADEDTTNDMSFDQVGVKAIDDYTVAYTCPTAMPYFPTCVTYSPYLPVNAQFLAEQGSDFGATENNILVNGAFRMTTHDYQAKIVFTKNDKYWDKEHVYVDKVTQTYLSGESSISTMREWYESGLVDSFTVQASDEEGYKKYVGDDYKNPVSPNCNAVASVSDATYIGYFNFARYTFEYNDAPSLGIKKTGATDAKAVAVATALKNKKIRESVLYGLEVQRYLKRFGDDQSLQRMTRSYTIPNLCAIDGKDYTDYVTAVYNEKNGTNLVDLTGDNNGKDPILNQSKAVELLTAAKAELIAGGLKETDFPLTLDVIGSTNATLAAFEKDMYDNFNNEVGKNILKFQIVTPQSDDQDEEWGSVTANYDFSIWSGWGPDYADPATFLHTFVIDGDMVESLGFMDSNPAYTDEQIAALQEELLGSYTAAYELGAAETSDLKKRYEAFAKAEYQLIYEDAIIVPWYTEVGYYNTVSNIVPYQATGALYGLSAAKYKNYIVSDTPISQEMRAAFKQEYNSAKSAK